MVDYSAYHWAKKAQQWAESIGTVLHYKGSVATYADLPSSDQQVGDMYNVLADGANYAWDGTAWDALSGIVDLSAYRTSADQDLIDAGKQPTLTTGTGISISSANVISVTSPTLTNVSTGNSSLSVLGAATTSGSATCIGVSSTAGANGTSLGKSANSGNGGLAIGTNSKANGSWSTAIGNGNSLSNTAEATASGAIAIGHNAHATASNAIQIFEGTNSTSDSLQVKTYELLDTSTGLIPDARISSNIARTSAIPTDYVTTNTAQTISQDKAFSGTLVVADNVGLASGTILSNKKIIQKTSSGIEVGNSTEDVLLVGKSATVRPKYNSNDLALSSDIKDTTITITQGGVTKGSFTTNQTSASTIALDAGSGLPSQTGQSGKFLTTDGTDASWATVDALPSQTGNNGKYLTTNGTSASWSVPKTNDLFDFKWTDYQLNDQNWLHADTYSWQDGTVYSDAYNHLVADISGKSASTETISGTTVTYYLADDGHKIVDVDDVSAIETVYASTGVAWYYVLDTVNTRFKLPRTKYGFTGLRDSVGKYVPESLPNITGKFPADMSSNTSWNDGVFSTISSDNIKGLSGASNSHPYALKFNANNSSSTYQDSAPVQQRATQMYLYFYVGQFSQSATEQTAGLNSELFNGKVDLNAANLSSQGKSLVSKLGMPSDNYDDLTLGASGATYTAPASGYFCVAKRGTTGEYIRMDGAGGLTLTYHIPANNAVGKVIMPASKGTDVYVSYSASGTTDLFRFVYAEGEV